MKWKFPVPGKNFAVRYQYKFSSPVDIIAQVFSVRSSSYSKSILAYNCIYLKREKISTDHYQQPGKE